MREQTSSFGNRGHCPHCMDYSKLPERSESIQNLILSPTNPRLGEAEELSADQGDIIAELIAEEKLFKLAESIALVGYLPNEKPFVVRRNKKYSCFLIGAHLRKR